MENLKRNQKVRDKRNQKQGKVLQQKPTRKFQAEGTLYEVETDGRKEWIRDKNLEII